MRFVTDDISSKHLGLEPTARLVVERESFERAAESPWGSSLVTQGVR